MSWTEDRIETLTRMWREGYSATQIATELGGVSRNAVVGKAHRLGLEARSLIMPKLLTKIEQLPIGRRTKNLIRSDNVIYVGDAVKKTEAEWLRTPNFGRRALNELKSALAGLDLHLGMDLVDWPPNDIESEVNYEETARRVAELQQAPGGATFEAVGSQFAMTTSGGDDDSAAAQKPLNQQMQQALLQRSREFSDLARRLDNQVGWSGIGRAVTSLTELLDRDPSEIPDVLGYIYPTAIELGSFMEFDQHLLAGMDSNASPLDPEVRRPLSDLVRNLAPWLRAFPSVRELDEEANRFLVKMADLGSTFELVDAAREQALLPEKDLEIFRQLRDAVERGDFLGEKGGGHAKRSAKNLLICVVAFLGSVYSGAIASDVSTTSPLAHKAGQFIVNIEKSATDLISDLPVDLRYALADFIMKFPSEFPVILPSSPEVINDTKRRRGLR